MSENIEIRAILRHYWKQGFKASKAAKKICEIEGKDTISIRTAQVWYKKFNEGHTSLENQPRSGRPLSLDPEVLREAVEESPTTSTRRLSAELGPSKDTISRHLKKLGMIKKRCREIPHEITDAQAKRRIEICRQLLLNPNDLRWIKRIVTCDEKWVYFDNPDMGSQWLNPGQTAKPVAKRERFFSKAMLCVWWNYEGVIHFEVVPNNRSIDSELYSAQLDRMHTALAQKYPALVNRKRVLLQQDNAAPHTSKRTKEKLQELDSIELLPHPAYSPDLAPSDFHLFRSMAHFLRGRKFSNIDQVETACQEFFDSHDKKWYQNGIEQLAERWLKTIEHNGLYFEI